MSTEKEKNRQYFECCKCRECYASYVCNKMLFCNKCCKPGAPRQCGGGSEERNDVHTTKCNKSFNPGAPRRCGGGAGGKRKNTTTKTNPIKTCDSELDAMGVVQASHSTETYSTMCGGRDGQLRAGRLCLGENRSTPKFSLPLNVAESHVTSTTSRQSLVFPTRGSRCTAKEPHGRRQFSCLKPSTLGGMQCEPLGNSYHYTGLQTPICLEAPRIQGNNILSCTRTWGRYTPGGNSFSAGQEGYTTSSAGSDSEGVFLPLLFGSEERGRASSHIGPKSPESSSSILQVQDADKCDAASHGSTRGLVHIRGFKGCILPRHDLSSTPEVPSFRIPREGLSVPGPAFRTIFESESFCQGYANSYSSPEAAGSAYRDVHRRHPCDRKRRADVTPTHQVSSEPSDFSGLQYKSRKEHDGTEADNRFYRHNVRLVQAHGTSVSRQDYVVQDVCSTVPTGQSSVVQNMHENVRIHGVGHIVNTTRQAVYETFSEMDAIAEHTQQSTLPSGCCHRGMCDGPAEVERHKLSVRGCSNGDSHIEKNNYYGCQYERMGSDPSGQIGQGLVGHQSADLSHKLFGAFGSSASSKAFPAFYSRLPCSNKDRQCDGHGASEQTGRASFSNTACTSTQDSDVERHTSEVAQSHPRSGGSEHGGGFTVQGCMSLRGMVPTPSSGGSTLGQVWPATSGPVRVGGERKVPTVLLHTRGSPSGAGCAGTQLAEGTSVCVPSVVSDHSHVREGEGSGVGADIGGPEVGSLGVRNNASSVRGPVATAAAQGPADAGEGGDISSSAGASRSLGLARQRLNLSTEGLSQRVIDTIQAARAQSTRDQYDRNWRVFEEWCEVANVVAFEAPIVSILSFLQDLMDKGRAFNTIKVYVAAISACHVGFGGKPVGEHRLLRQYMKGVRHLRPIPNHLVPTWDLAVVLDSLSQPPFEPLEEVDMKFLSFKTAILVALTTTKRVSDIHALSVSPECMRFLDDDLRVIIKPNPGFVPKNPLAKCVPADLDAFYPPPFSSVEERRLHNLCPVRALRVYTDRTRASRKSDQLFVAYASSVVGKPITKVRLSQWIVEAIQVSYSSKGMVIPEGLRAHSTRGMSASWALCRGVSIQDVCAAASWSSPLTFAKFYRLNVAASSLGHAVLGVASR